MEWKEFIRYIEGKGVKDNTDIFFMEFFQAINVDELDVEFYDDGSFSVEA